MDKKQARTPLGGSFTFLNAHEKEYFENALKEYKRRYSFEHPADLTALENLLIAQLLAYRYSRWLSEGRDYDKNPINTTEVLSQLMAIQQKIQNLLTLLGLSRREREENLSAKEIISSIAEKAKRYGLHKNKVAWEFLISSYRIRDLLDSYYRMNDTERRKFGYTAEEVIEKVKNILEPLEQMEEEFKKERNLWKTTIRGDLLVSGETD